MKSDFFLGWVLFLLGFITTLDFVLYVIELWSVHPNVPKLDKLVVVVKMVAVLLCWVFFFEYKNNTL